jgi:hypothetical protein
MLPHITSGLRALRSLKRIILEEEKKLLKPMSVPAISYRCPQMRNKNTFNTTNAEPDIQSYICRLWIHFCMPMCINFQNIQSLYLKSSTTNHLIVQKKPVLELKWITDYCTCNKFSKTVMIFLCNGILCVFVYIYIYIYIYINSSLERQEYGSRDPAHWPVAPSICKSWH